MNLADPVSSGKYSGMCVSTAPVAEPTAMSFTVPLTGSTIVATAAVVTTCGPGELLGKISETVSATSCSGQSFEGPCKYGSVLTAALREEGRIGGFGTQVAFWNTGDMEALLFVL